MITLLIYEMVQRHNLPETPSRLYQHTSSVRNVAAMVWVSVRDIKEGSRGCLASRVRQSRRWLPRLHLLRR